MALPLLVLKPTTTVSDVVALSVTVNVAVPDASLTVISPIDTIGSTTGLTVIVVVATGDEVALLSVTKYPMFAVPLKLGAGVKTKLAA